ncbi:MAG TPA: hypothetical protein VK507_24240, partial [Iamia sp.]|nr:hypothetical protein [Iamia sp.]
MTDDASQGTPRADLVLTASAAAIVMLVIARRAIEGQLERLHAPGVPGAGYGDLRADAADTIETWVDGKAALDVFQPVRARALVEQRSVVQLLLVLVITASVGVLLSRRRRTVVAEARVATATATADAARPGRAAQLVRVGDRVLEATADPGWPHRVALVLFAGFGLLGIALDNLVIQGHLDGEGLLWRVGDGLARVVPPAVLVGLGAAMTRPIITAVPPKWIAYRSAPASARLTLWIAVGTFVLFNVSDIGAQLEDLLRREVAAGDDGDWPGTAKIVGAVAAYLVVILASSRLRRPDQSDTERPWWTAWTGVFLVALGLFTMWRWAWTSALTTLGVMLLVVGLASWAVLHRDPMGRRRALGTRVALVLLLAGLAAIAPSWRLGDAPHVWFGLAAVVLVVGGSALLRLAQTDSEAGSLPEGAAGVVLVAFAARAVMGPVTEPWVVAIPPIVAVGAVVVLAWSLRHRPRGHVARSDRLAVTIRALGAAVLAGAAALGWVRPNELVGWVAAGLALVGLVLLLHRGAARLRERTNTTEETDPQPTLTLIETSRSEPATEARPAHILDREAPGVLVAAAVLPLLGLLVATVRVLAATLATGEGDPVPWALLGLAGVLVVGAVGAGIVLGRPPESATTSTDECRRDASVAPGWVIVVVAGAAAGPCLALLTLVPVDTLAVDIGRRAGPFVVLIALLTGLAATCAVARFAVLSQGQPSLFRYLGFNHMPMVGMVVTWIVLIVVVGAPLERVEATSHHVRTLSGSRSTVRIPTCGDAELLATIRSGAEDDGTVHEQLVQELCRWITTVRADSPSEGRREVLPLVLVTASGGGVRAAAWTMRVLDCLLFAEGAATPDEEGRAPCPSRVQGRADHWRYLFAAGGASGGSVGIASAVAQRLFPVPARVDGQDLDRWTRSVPEAEHVGALTTQMVAELGLATAGVVTEHDRAEELIDSWAATFGPPDLQACPRLSRLARRSPPASVEDLGFLQASAACPDEVPL